MTLLKRLREEARKQARWLHALIELKDVENSLDGITANTVTAVLDEIEREVDTAWLEELSRKERNQGATAIGLSRAKAIISNFRNV